MKHLPQYILEGIFDDDLVKKGVKLDFKTARNKLFDFCRRETKMFNKDSIFYQEGNHAAYIKRNIDGVTFEIRFGINIMCPLKDRTYAIFETPVLSVTNSLSHFATSMSDSNATIRWIRKKSKSKFLQSYQNAPCYWFATAEEDNIGDVFKIYDTIIKEFCSDEFGIELKKYVKNFIDKHTIPGFVMDTLMKKLIEKI